MSPRRIAAAIILAAAPAAAHAAPDLTADQALPRVEHHVKEAEQISRHFQTVMQSECQHFATPAQWRGYFDAELDRMVLMMAHIEQAWVEAKRTGDDDVRRTAKAPRKRIDDARALMDKMQGCASDNGTSFATMQVWRKIERDVPRRQAEIALPDTPSSAAPASQ
jgi:hypothetical protein